MVESLCGMQSFNFTPTYLYPVSCSIIGEICAQDRKKDEFMALEQGGTSVAAYQAKFHASSRYATQLVTTEEESMRLFIRGLNSELQVLSVHMTSTCRSFNEVSNYVKKVERVK